MPCQDKKIPLLAVVGPTASGKTGLGVELALRFGGEVVCADSKQIYRHMAVSTAAPTEEETKGVPHHLFQFLPPDQSFSVADYVSLAQNTIRQIHQRGKLPVLVGGTGMYVQSLVDNIAFFETKSDPDLRRELEETAQKYGNQYLLDQLAKIDPMLAEKLHPNNLGRIIRAIEAYRLTGIPMSRLQEDSRQTPSPYDCLMIGLSFRDRQVLYQRIDRRVEVMVEKGILEEIQTLIRLGYSHTAAQAIGCKEFFPHLRGEGSLAEAIAQVQMQSRRYAKRQLTWFRRDERINWLYRDDYADYNGFIRGAVRLVENWMGK